ncbi:MAG TPA: hypothetical protein VFS00_05105, partial [Polyangiaceae bacterium]|nr:hypothetical protein [Polyangiaceae bacterium]
GCAIVRGEVRTAMLAPTPAPPSFDASFLTWFREVTERAWAECETPTLEGYRRAGVGGGGFQRGTRWAGGLSEAQVEAVERARSLRFPPDYRLFLRTLHATTPPQVGAGFVDGDRLELYPRAGFYDWLREDDEIRAAEREVVDGLLFDVEHSDLWLPTWGPRPDAAEGREVRLRELVDAAPRLVPVFGHRFLVAEPCRAGNPVLSVHQSDIIVYGRDLRTYLLVEFDLPSGDGAVPQTGDPDDFRDIPFWGELVG